MLVATDLVKHHGARRAVDGLSLRLLPGSILGLLGPNGAGKSTTVAMLAGLLPPDAGEVRVAGLGLHGDAAPGKRRIGLVPQDLALYESLSARQNLAAFGPLYGLRGAWLAKQVDAALEVAGLMARADERVATFSGGMKRRLNIACALLHEPDVLMFDEPTVGIDPQSRLTIFETLQRLRDAGKALLYTTHAMEEAERLCDHIAIIDQGRLLAHGTLAELLALAPASATLRVTLGSVTGERHERRLPLASLSDAPAALAAVLAEGLTLCDVRSERATLEDVFLSLTGRALRDGGLSQ